jgi:hypothetical protein
MDRSRASRVRQLIRQTEEARQAHVDALVSTEALVEGSFVTVGRSCGKPTCRCARGEKHYSKYLSRSVEGRTQLVYVPAGDEVRVQGRAHQYRQLRHARAELLKLAARTAELADELQAALVELYPEPGRTPKRARRKRGNGGAGAAT